MTEKVVDWGLSCGRGFLTVDGFVVAIEGQQCFDEAFPRTDYERELGYSRHSWTIEDFKRICGDG